MFDDLFNDTEPVEFEREESSGRFAPSDIIEDSSVPSDRSADDGRFVSKEREETLLFRDKDGKIHSFF